MINHYKCNTCKYEVKHEEKAATGVYRYCGKCKNTLEQFQKYRVLNGNYYK